MEKKILYIEVRAPKDLTDEKVLDSIRTAVGLRATKDPRLTHVEARKIVPAAAGEEGRAITISLDEKQRGRAEKVIRDYLPYVRVEHRNDIILCPPTNAMYFMWGTGETGHLTTVLITKEETAHILG